MHSTRIDKITPIEEAWQAVIATPEYINWLQSQYYVDLIRLPVVLQDQQRLKKTKLVEEAWQAVEDSSAYQNYALRQQHFTEAVERERQVMFRTWFDLK